MAARKAQNPGFGQNHFCDNDIENMTVYHMKMVLPLVKHCEAGTVTVPRLNCNTI